MTKDSSQKQKWVELGYKQFALHGPKNLSIKKLSKNLGSSRGAFYHYFEDIDIFIQELLDMHWQIALEYCSTGKKECKTYYPDMFLLCEKFPIPMKFNWQLFTNRNNPLYNYLFIRVSREAAKSFVVSVFSEQFGFKENYEDTYDLHLTIEESWYSRLNFDHLSSALEMQKLAEEIINSILKFVSTDLYSKLKKNY